MKWESYVRSDTYFTRMVDYYSGQRKMAAQNFADTELESPRNKENDKYLDILSRAERHLYMLPLPVIDDDRQQLYPGDAIRQGWHGYESPYYTAEEEERIHEQVRGGPKPEPRKKRRSKQKRQKPLVVLRVGRGVLVELQTTIEARWEDDGCPDVEQDPTHPYHVSYRRKRALIFFNQEEIDRLQDRVRFCRELKEGETADRSNGFIRKALERVENRMNDARTKMGEQLEKSPAEREMEYV